MRFSTLSLVAIPICLVFSAPLNKRVKNFQWFGVNESGAEFGSGTLPGTLGTDYTFPVDSTIDTLVGDGFNIFRIPFLMERAVPSTLTGSIASAYVSDLEAIVNYITNTKGAYAIICAQNFGRYYGNIIEDTTGFEAFWKTIATQFQSNSKVIFDTNNEYHDMDQQLVYDLNYAAITGIRAAGATSQYIFVEGNDYTAARTWATTNDNLKNLYDSEGKLVYEMHLYLDSDGSGTSSTCVSTSVGTDRISDATSWLKTNGKIGIIGEFAGGANSVCGTAVENMIEYMQENSDVWKGALWWGGGPWWGDYIFSFEPPSGTGYEYYLSALEDLF